MVTRYLLHGVRLLSDVALPDVTPRAGGHTITALVPGDVPGLNGRAGADGPADVRIELLEYQPVGVEPPPGDLILDHHVHGHRQYAASRTGGHLRLRVPGYADFDVSGDLTRIACAPDPRVAPGYLPLMLTGNVLSFLMTLAGRTVLHAGAVEVAGGALVVVGPSGVGKSTLTAWLCTAGARLVTDDVLRLDGDATCHRGGREIRLRDRAYQLARRLEQSGSAIRRTVDGRFAVRPPATASARLPVRAIVIPRPSPGSRDLRELRDLVVRRMDAVSSAMVLAGVPRTLGWRLRGPSHTHFTTAADVAATVPVHVVDIPWGPPFDPGTPRRLLEQLGVEPTQDGATREALDAQELAVRR